MMHPLLALYKRNDLNQLSKTDALQTLDIDQICEWYRSLMLAAPQRHRSGKQYFVGHSGFPSGDNGSNRFEEHLAMAMFNASRFGARSFELPNDGRVRLVDYQFPLKERRSDDGVGKVDIVGTAQDGKFVLIELKVLGQGRRPQNSPLQAFLEGLAYSAIVKSNLDDIAQELESTDQFSVRPDRILLCILAPEDYWAALGAIKSNVKEVITFAETVGSRLDLDVRFLSIVDYRFEMGSIDKAPKLLGRCVLHPVNGSMKHSQAVLKGYDAYTEQLCTRYWGYARRHSLLDPTILEQEQPSRTRPPVFQRHEAGRNLIQPPAADTQTKQMVIDAIPEAARHQWFGSMKSSQALAQTVFGNLAALRKLDLLSVLIDEDDLPAFFADIGDATLSMEHSLQSLKEPRPTSIDVWIQGSQRVAVECKLTEQEFGTCSRTRRNPAKHADYCDGSYRVQMNRTNRCSLTESDIRYWRYIPEFFDWPANMDMVPCAFGANYQLVRNVLAACVETDGSISLDGGHALVIYDQRNPAFQEGGVGHRQWCETKAALKYPHLLRRCSWQQLVGLIANVPELNWLARGIEDKYGFAQATRTSDSARDLDRTHRLERQKDSNQHRPIGLLVTSEEDSRKRLSAITHEKCQAAIQTGAWEVSDSVARPKSILWLDCWARTGLNSEIAREQAKDAFEAIFGLDHDGFVEKVEHTFSRRHRTSSNDAYIIGELEKRLSWQSLQKQPPTPVGEIS